MTAIQPSKASLNSCTINGINYLPNNFHVKELRIYEDICKFYFTGQLVIETEQNAHEFLIGPTVPVTVDFDSPRTDGGPTRAYRSRFRIHSYESKPLSGGTDARMQHTIQLISQEFYNDRHNTVMKGFSNVPGTAAAAEIHGQYIAVNGGLRIPIPSTGLIASEKVPQQARNVKPVKAIHDILDRCVFAAYKTCAPTYFRDVNGYVIAPMQWLLEASPTMGRYLYQKLGAGNETKEVMEGYELVKDFKPLAPPGEANADSSTMAMGIGNAAQFLDMKDGSTINIPAAAAGILGLPFISKVPNLKARVTEMLAEASRGTFGGRNMMFIVDQLQQPLSTMKNGPGGYNQAQEALLTALTYSQKYWTSIPLQSGLNCTCGGRIDIVYPVVEGGRVKQIYKKLFVPRLIHQIMFTEGAKREAVTVNGTTDLYCVQW